MEVLAALEPGSVQINKMILPPPFHEDVIQGTCIICKHDDNGYGDLTLEEWNKFCESDHTEALNKYNGI